MSKILKDIDILRHSCEGRMVEILELSEPILQRFRAIDITIKMIGECELTGCLITPVSLPIDKSDSGFAIVDIYLSQGYKRLIPAPTFIWSYISKQETVHYILFCEEDYALKYPVRSVTINRVLGGKLKTAERIINNDQMLIDSLDYFLHNL